MNIVDHNVDYCTFKMFNKIIWSRVFDRDIVSATASNRSDGYNLNDFRSKNSDHLLVSYYKNTVFLIGKSKIKRTEDAIIDVKVNMNHKTISECILVKMT